MARKYTKVEQLVEIVRQGNLKHVCAEVDAIYRQPTKLAGTVKSYAQIQQRHL